MFISCFSYSYFVALFIGLRFLFSVSHGLKIYKLQSGLDHGALESC
jgi:hypothetical protein